VKKLTGGFDNGLGAVLIGERSLALVLSKKSREGISGLFQQYRPKAGAGRKNKMRCTNGSSIASGRGILRV
jgi:hypothetical protein